MPKADPVVASAPAKPPAPEIQPGSLALPRCPLDDPAQLAAWFGPFGWADHLRKVKLANCREMIRAMYTMTETKISESRLDDLAHSHGAYVEWLTENLQGRIAYEREVIKQGTGR